MLDITSIFIKEQYIGNLTHTHTSVGGTRYFRIHYRVNYSNASEQ